MNVSEVVGRMKEDNQQKVQDAKMMKRHLWPRSRSRRGFNFQFLVIFLEGKVMSNYKKI
jgi:hypothetical protein